MGKPIRLAIPFFTFALFLLTFSDAFAALPRAHHVYISGTTAGANPATYSGMEVGLVLKVWYTYADADLNPESGTTFQWYTYDDQFGTNKLAIAGATSQTFTLLAAQVGKHISVEVKPKNATDGFGATVEFKPWDTTHSNIVYAANQACTKAGGGTVGTGNILDATSPLCSPRTTSWAITYTGIDWSSTKPPKVWINWGDGGGFVSVTPTLSNSLLTQVDTFNLVNQANQVWVTTQPHTYNYSAGSTPSTVTGQRCTYTLQTTWGYLGLGCGSSGVQTQPFTVWDKEDNTNLGTLDINHVAGTGGVETGEETDICEKDQTAIKVRDNSTFNCTNPLETVRINDEVRWVQWVYGTSTDIVTGPGATEKFVINGVSYTTADLPVYGNVTYQPTTTTAPTSVSDGIIMPTTATANQTFIVTMRTWNYCNMLDLTKGNNPNTANPLSNNFVISGTTNQPALLTEYASQTVPIKVHNNPVTRTYTIKIITKPTAPIAVNKEFCAGTTLNPPAAACGSVTAANQQISFELTSASVTGSTVISWYFGDPRTGGVAINSNANVYSGGTNCRLFRPAGLLTTGAQGTMRTALLAGTPGQYSLWATYSTANGCTSDPVEVKMTIRPTLTAPGAATGTSPVCNDGSTVNGYAQGSAAAAMSIAANNISNASVVSFPTEYFWDTNTTGVTTSSTTGTSVNVTYNIATQPNPSTTVNIQTALRYSSTITYTTGATTDYCQTTKTPLTVTVFGISVGGTTSPSTQTICQGAAPAAIVLSGQRGSITGWEVQVNGAGGFNVDPALGTSSTINPAVPIVGAVQTKYEFRAVVKNGPCSVDRSSIATIIVNPKPISATLSGGTTMCQGSSTNLVVNIVGGTSPYQVKYSDGSSTFTVNGYVSGANISVSPSSTVTYTLVSVSDAASCVPTTLSGSALVTVSNPTSAVMSGTQNVCPSPNSVNIVVTITGGAGPFTVNYKDNLGGTFAENNYTSANNITITNIASTRTYSITSVIDANGCPSLANSGNAVITVGAPLTTATFSGGATVCQGVVENLKLTISGGVAPYHITVTPTSGPVIDNTSYTSGSNILVPTSAVGSIDYNVTLIIDACGNSLPLASIVNNPQTVLVNPVPVGAVTKTVTAICSKANVSVDIFNTSVATAAGGNNIASTYTWTASYDAGLTGGPASGSGDLGTAPVFALTNVSGGQLIATFTITPKATSGGCNGTPFTIKVPVNTEPKGATTTTTAAQCSNTTFNINPFTTSVATAAGGNNVTSTYTWTRVLDPGLTLITPGTLTGNISEKIENKTSGVLNATYTVTPTSTVTLCIGSTFTIKIPINPEPVAAALKTTASQCSSVAFSFDPQTISIATAAGGNNVSSTFTWTASYDPGLTGGAASGTGNVAGTLVNKSAGVLNATYTITPKSVTGNCTGQNFTIVVPVNAEADVTVQPANSPVCVTGSTSTGSVSFSVTATGPGITYKWQEKIPAGSFADLSDGTVGTVTYAGTGTAMLSISGAVIGMNNNQYRVVLSTTGSCKVNSNAAILTVNPLPTANNKTIQQCSDAPGGIVAVLDLTSFNTQVNSGVGLTFTWWKDAAATAFPITPGSAGGQDQNYTVSNGDILYARVHNTSTLCDNIGQVTFTINTTPVGNPIIGTDHACVSTNTVFYQVTQHAGAKYSWNIPSQFTVVAGGGGATSGGGQGPYSAEYYVLLQFPTASAVPINLSITEQSAAGCFGLPNVLPITVANGPTVIPIAGGNSFCKDQKGVVFTVPANPTSNFIWQIDGGANLGGHIVGASAGTGLNQIIVDFNGLSSAQIDVTEINVQGCPGIYPSLVVSLVDSPILTPLSKSICSGDQPSSVIDLNAQVTQSSTFSWFVKTIDPNITGAFQNDTGSGPLEHFPPLKNISGTNGTVVYTVTPTAISAPFCVGLSQDFTVVVKPEPVVNTVADASFCPGQAVSIPLSSNVGGATMNWTSSNSAVGLVAASGTGTISFTAADNLTGVDITTTINVTATANGCTSAGANSKFFVIKIRPRPVVAAITNIIVCPGDAISVPAFASNTGGGETYAWTNDNSAIGLGTSGSGNIAGFFAPANNTGVNVVGNISVIGSLNGCAGPPRTFTITIKPEPVVASVTNKSFCPGDVLSIPLSSNVTGAVINWTNSNTSIGLAASGTGNISGTAAANNTGADIVATIMVTASDNSCTSTGTNQKSFTITIKPTPIVDTITDIAVCSGGTVPTILFGSNITAGGVTFNWTNNNTLINLPASGSGNIASFTAAVNTTGIPLVANISVTGTKNTCSGLAKVFKITVNPEPVVAAVTSNSFCPGDAVSFALTSNVVGATLNWTNSNPAIGLTATGSGDINFTAPANNTGADITGTINVTATSNSCTSAGANAKSFTITIKPTPIVNAVTDVTVCSGATVPAITFTANTPGGETYNWTNDNSAVGQPTTGSGSILSYTAPVNITGAPIIGNFVVSAVRNSCPGPTKTFKITINPEPVVSTVIISPFCPGESISIPLTSNVAGATLNWTNTNASIGLATSGTGDINYIAPANNTGSNITGTITVTASKNGCTSSGTNAKTFVITIKPTPIVNAISNVVVCSGQAVSAIAFGSNAGSGVTFDWTNDTPSINLGASGNGNISAFTAAVNTSSSPVVATISVTGTKNLCTGPAKTFTITVLPQPVGAPTAVTICSDQAVGVNLNTLITSGASASSYDITINSNGLAASAGAPADGFGLPAAEILDDKWTNLTGSSVDVVYSIVPISGSTPNCSGTSFNLTVHVNPEPVVAAVTNKFYCPATVQVIPLTSNVGSATINWTNDNPSIGLGVSGTGNISFTTASNNTGASIVANITVTASKSSCISAGANVKTFQITLRPTPIVDPITDVTVCSGGSISTIAFTANTGGGESFSWTNDNTAIGKPASGTGNIIGYTAPVNISGVPIVANFLVSAAINGCPGPAKAFKITVNPEPVVTAITNKEFCAGESINIPLLSNVGGASLTWTNDNTSIGLGASGSGDIAYVAPVNNTGSDMIGTITAIATKNSCVSAGANAKTFTITIKPTPIVNPLSNITVCSGESISAILFGSNVATGGVTFNWTNDNTAINLLASGTGDIPSFTAATNTTGSPIVANISVTGTKNTCVGPAKTFTITIDPVPVIASGLDNHACSQNAVGLVLSTNGTSVSAINYNILSRVVDPGLTVISTASIPGGGAFGVSSIYVSGDKFKNTTNAPLPVVYTVKAVGAIHNCVGPQMVVTMMIDPEPVVSTTLNNAVCSNQPINLTLNTNGISVAAATYNILNRTISGGLTVKSTVTVPATGVANNYLAIDKFENLTSSAATVTYLVEPVAGGALTCIGAQQLITITINPEPTGSDFTEPGCTSGIALNHDLQSQITNGIVSQFTYTVSSTNPGVAAEADRIVASNAHITHTYTNTTGSPAQIVYIITASTSAFAPNCTATTVFKYIVNVDSKPVAGAFPRAAVCSGDPSFSYNPQDEINAGNSVASTFVWDLVYDGGAPVHGTGNITGSFINESTAPKNAVYTVTPTSASGGNCTGDPFIITIVVNPIPVMVAVPTVQICSTNSSVTHPSGVTLMTTSSSAAPSGYNIRLKSIDAGLDGIGTTPDAVGLVGTNVPASTLSAYAYNNTSSATLSVVFGVVPVSSIGGCLGAEIDIKIMVNPEPVLSVAPPSAICSNNLNNSLSTTGIVLGTNGVSVNAQNYRIDNIEYASNPGPVGPFGTIPPADFTFPVTNKIISSAGGVNHIKADQFTNRTQFPVVVRYTITPISAGNCEGVPAQISITVEPEPILDPTLTASICSGDKIDPTGTAFQLKSKTGSVASTAFLIRSVVLNGAVASSTNAAIGIQLTKDGIDNDSFIYTAGTSPINVIYTIAPISSSADGSCIGSDQIVTIVINPAPALKTGLDNVVCNDNITGIVLDTAPASTAANRYNIVSVKVVPPTAGPDVAITPGATVLGLTADASNAPLGITTNQNIIRTDKFHNSTAERIVVKYEIVPMSAANCSGPPVIVTVIVEPTSTSDSGSVPSNITQICSGEAVDITFRSPTYSNGDPANPSVTFSYQLDSSVPHTGISGYSVGNNLNEGDKITDVLVNSTNAAVTVQYLITPKAAAAAKGAGCVGTPEPVLVVVQPRPKITVIPNKTVCEGDAINLNLSSLTVPSTGVIKFLVTAVAENGSVTGFTTTGTYLANGTILADALSNSDVEPRYIDYTFEPQNVVNSTNAIICANGTPITVRVTVNPRPEVTPSASALEICSSESIEVQLPTDTDQSSTLVKWTANASSLNIIGESNGAGDVLFQTLLNNGTTVQTVDYTITPSFSGCAGTPKHLIVTVNPIPSVTVPSKITVCGGDPFILDLAPLATTASATTTFKWEVTDINEIGALGQFDGTGTLINQLIVNNTTASASLLYQITPIFIGNGAVRCEGIPKIVNVTIAPAINGNFISTDEYICEGTPVFLTFGLDGQAPFEFVYRATDMNGDIADNTLTKSGNVKVLKVTPAVTTVYEIVSIKDALGCSKILTPAPKVIIKVFKSITAGWVANAPPFIGGTSSVGFTNTSDPVNGDVFRYEWTFDTDNSSDPHTANGEGPFTVNYNRPGDHYVSMHAVNIESESAGLACESTYAAKITIPVLPLTAGFKLEPNVACFPQNITITENTSTGDTMDWRVIDSNGRVAATSAAPLPEFLISTPGLYTVTLETSNSFTGQNAFAPSQEVTIYENPVASFDLRPQLVYIPDTEITTFNFSTGASEYLWDFGDGNTSIDKEPKYTYKVEGKYDVTLIAINDHGDGAVCTDTLKRQVIAKQGGVTKVPNAFTPNPNGPNGGIAGNNTFNDVFLPIVKGAEEFNMQIFDRWGNLIFETNNSTIGWDGYDKHGRLLPAGVYVYKLTLRLSDGQRSTQIGDITMIR
jgi:gliding motility-associated-like protein